MPCSCSSCLRRRKMSHARRAAFDQSDRRAEAEEFAPGVDLGVPAPPWERPSPYESQGGRGGPRTEVNR